MSTIVKTRNGERIFAMFNGSLTDEISGQNIQLTTGTSSFVPGPFENTQALRLEAGVAKAKFANLLPNLFFRRATVILWGKPRNFTGNTMLWHSTPGFSSTNMARALISNGSRKVDGIYNSGDATDCGAYTDNNLLTQDAWSFVGMSWMIGKSVDMWIGTTKKQGGIARAARRVSNDFWLGSRNDSTAVAWDIGGLIVFNRKLSDEEMTAYANLVRYPLLGEKLVDIQRVMM